MPIEPLALTLAIAVAAAPAPAADAHARIEAVMGASAAAWNAGQLDRFVAVYAEDAVYIGKDGLVSGRRAIADRYRPSFANGTNERGRLSFRTLGWRTVGPAHELMYARWTLSRADGSGETGMTTLLFERRPEGWRIITDHSS